MEIQVVGGGLAGTEAAYQIARRGQKVRLYEMRPETFTPAHKTSFLSELVCSNSLKSQDLSNAHGLLKEELRRLDSIVLRCAGMSSIPGGKALVVDRNVFAGKITEEIEAHPLIEVIRHEITDIPDGITIIATGPLTSDTLAARISEITGTDRLSFFDAISPIIDGESIDMNTAFFGSRYAGGTDDYLNCPFTEDQYNAFYDALISAERVALHDFEKTSYFEGCPSHRGYGGKRQKDPCLRTHETCGSAPPLDRKEISRHPATEERGCHGHHVQYGGLSDEINLP